MAYTEILYPETYVPYAAYGADPFRSDFQVYCPGCGYTGYWANNYPALAVSAVLSNDSAWEPGQEGSRPLQDCCPGRHVYVGAVHHGNGRFTVSNPTINGVVSSVNAILLMSDPPYTAGNPLAWVGGVAMAGGVLSGLGRSNYPPGYGWRILQLRWTTNPVSGLAWTLADVANLDVGFILSKGTGFGPYTDQTYIEVVYSLVPPTVATQSATNVQSDHATINGSLTDDGGEACTLFFEWGDSPSLGNLAPAGTGSTGASFSANIVGLLAGRNYYFRAGATNSRGTAYGAIMGLTSTTPPVENITVLTMAALDVGESGGKLRGMVQDSLGRIGDVRFEWGVTTAYGNTTPWQEGFYTGDLFEYRLRDLVPGMVYHFRAQFRGSGIVSGADMSFCTLASEGPVIFVDEETISRLEGIL